MVTLVHGSTLIQDSNRHLANGALAFDGEAIVAVGSFDELRDRWPDAPVLGGPGKIVLPGLANAHDHGRAVGTLDLGLTDGVLESWRPDQAGYTWPNQYDQALGYGLQMLRTGVTTLVQHHPPGVPQGKLLENAGAALRGFRDAGLRVCFALGVWDQQRLVYAPEEQFLASLPPDLAAHVRASLGPPVTLDETLATARALIEEARGSRVTVYLGPYAAQWVSEDLFKAVHQAAESLDTGLHMHLLETVYQRMWVDRTFGRPIAEVLDDWGVLDGRLTCAHAVWLSDRDIDLLARRGARVSHNPSSNLRLQSGVARVPLMLDRGMTVGVGLDGMSFLQPDLFAEMRQALALGRPPGFATPALDAQTVFRMATQGGTRAALGRDDLGVLEVGRPADLIVLDGAGLSPYPSVPRDPVEWLVWRGRPELVETVIVGGETLVENGRHLKHDLGELNARLDAELAQVADRRPEPWRAELRAEVRSFFDGWGPPPAHGWAPAAV